MHILAKGKADKNVVVASDAELLLIMGRTGPVVEGMFTPGKKINVAEQWAKLRYFRENANQLRTVVQRMRDSATQIEEAIPPEEAGPEPIAN